MHNSTIKINWVRLFQLGIFTIISLALSDNLYAQNNSDKDVYDAFNLYNSLSREIAYCQLNKSTYIKGESLGFSAYVLNKDLKTPSDIARNLYCVITDKNDKVIKKKMIYLKDGFANNLFEIDSLFTSGDYTFKAYTNWMKNFDEKNAFIESFKVIDPEVESEIKNDVINENIDAQFLPEGGHYINQVRTQVGVVIKNQKGLGIPNLEGSVYDSKNNLLTSFKTNTLGITKFNFVPVSKESYVVKLRHFNKDFQFVIKDIKEQGISMSVRSLKKSIAVEIKTNDATLKNIDEDDLYKVTIHNGKQIKSIDVSLNREKSVVALGKELLYPGINIFTLFDPNNEPITERMMFNYEGVQIVSSKDLNFSKSKDSVQVFLSLKKFANTNQRKSNVSISILPSDTKAYKRHQNIISQTYVQPYVKGFIENAQYYFTNIDDKKKYDLDNLLLTQGWSSYSWNDIFNKKVEDTYPFEDGIVMKANQNEKKVRKNFLLYPLELNQGMTVNLKDNEHSFVVSKLYPTGSEKLGVANLKKNGKLRKPELKVEFTPSQFPSFTNYQEVLPVVYQLKTKTTKVSPLQYNLNKVQQLDEVVVKAKERQIKIEKLQGKFPFSTVDLFDDNKRNLNLTFAGYINYYVPKYFAYESFGGLQIERRVSTSLRDSSQTPLIYLDDILLSNLQQLYGFNMNVVDYVTVNESGNGQGIAGANGIIRIYTSLDYMKKRKVNKFGGYSFPLAFAERRKYYVPKYKSIYDDFYANFGVVGWVPDAKADAFGNITFSVFNPANKDLKLFIEGITNKGEVISEIKVLPTSTND